MTHFHTNSPLYMHIETHAHMHATLFRSSRSRKIHAAEILGAEGLRERVSPRYTQSSDQPGGIMIRGCAPSDLPLTACHAHTCCIIARITEKEILLDGDVP